MLKKPANYDEVQVGSDFTPIELGGHKGIIKNVEIYESQFSGSTSLKVSVDTAKDDKQPEYYLDQYKNDDRENKTWPAGAVKYVSLKEDENCVRMLKGFITAVENSNPGFTYDWDKDEKEQLKDKKIGLVFGLEEYTDQEGKTKTARKVNQFRSIDKVDNALIPKVKLLDGSTIDYESYTNSNSNSTSEGTVEIVLSDDKLPF